MLIILNFNSCNEVRYIDSADEQVYQSYQYVQI